MNEDPTAVWTLPTPHTLVWSEFDDEHIVYHPGSGETHYLNDFSTLALRCLADAPSSADALCLQLQELLGSQCPENLHQQVDAMLARFDQLGLIERCNPIGSSS